MDKKVKPTYTETVSSVSPEIAARIYLEPLTPEEREIVSAQKEKLLDPSDLGGVELNKNLRDSLAGKSTGENGHQIHDLARDLGTEAGYRATLELARAELLGLPPDTLVHILGGLKPFAKSMQAGHGKAHMLRDIVNMNAIFQDPELEHKPIDEVELVVGMFAGTLHDFGVAISDRYEDVHRVGAHAEISAVLFGNVAEELIPHNLIRLIQNAIGAHTHYLKPREVTLPDGTIATQEPYKDEVVNGQREGIWLTRKADRSDTANFAHIVRDMIVRAKPIQDYDGNDFGKKMERDEAFLNSYGLTDGRGIINHDSMFAKNVFTENPYTAHDSKYFIDVLRTPAVGDIVLLLAVIAPDKKDELLADIEAAHPEAAQRLQAEIENHTQKIDEVLSRPVGEIEIEQSLEQFKNVCRIIEPAEDLEHQLASFEELFPLLPEEDRVLWARGFMFMAEVSMGRWMNRLAESAAIDPHLGQKITSQDPAMQQLIEEHGRNLQALAQDFVAAMHRAV